MSEIVLHAPFAGWLSALDEVDDPVFAGRMMGDGFAIDPLDGLLRTLPAIQKRRSGWSRARSSPRARTR